MQKKEHPYWGEPTLVKKEDGRWFLSFDNETREAHITLNIDGSIYEDYCALTIFRTNNK